MKNKKKFMLALAILFSVFTGKVSAANIQQRPIEVDDRNVVKVYDDISSTPIEENIIAKSRTMFLSIDDVVAYCLDFGTPLGIPSSQGDTSVPSGVDVSLDKYLSTKFTNDSQRIKLIEDLNLIYYYGYNKNDSARNSDKYYLATQAKIWQRLSDAGMYSSLKSGQLEELYDVGRLPQGSDTENLKVSNIRFMKYDGSLYTTGSLNHIPYVENDIVDTATATNKIDTAINKYRTLPSICSSTKVKEMGVNDTLTLEDTNGVLNKYSVDCTNATCSIQGDKLIINSGSTPGDIEVTLTRTGEGINQQSTVYQIDDSHQGVAVIGGSLPEMSCTLGATVINNVQTSGLRIAYISLVCGFALAMTFVYFYSKKQNNE